MDFYADSPARKRAIEAPQLEPPPDQERADPPLPIDASDNGSDTGETETHKAWHRQHQAIGIDEERDIIADEGIEVYSYLQHAGIEHRARPRPRRDGHAPGPRVRTHGPWRRPRSPCVAGDH